MVMPFLEKVAVGVEGLVNAIQRIFCVVLYDADSALLVESLPGAGFELRPFSVHFNGAVLAAVGRGSIFSVEEWPSAKSLLRGGRLH